MASEPSEPHQAWVQTGLGQVLGLSSVNGLRVLENHAIVRSMGGLSIARVLGLVNSIRDVETTTTSSHMGTK